VRCNSDGRTLAAQLAALREQHHQSRAHEHELVQQLQVTSSRLAAAEQAAAKNNQLQAKLDEAHNSLAAANSSTKRLQTAYQDATEQLRWQNGALGQEQAAHTSAGQQVRRARCACQ
jgi:chromosome segregation ATPase